MVVEIDTHREPIESIGSYGMILSIGGSDELVHLLHRGGEVSRRESLRVFDIEEVLATDQAKGQSDEGQCTKEIFHKSI